MGQGKSKSSAFENASSTGVATTSSKVVSTLVQQQQDDQHQHSSTAAAIMSGRLALGAGCYWGTEKYIRKDFQKQFPGSIKTVTVGFMAPETVPARYKNPTYQQVCSGQSGHIEVAYVELHDPVQHLEELIRFFFQFHDPTTPNRQGNDRGFQYASWIFCDDAQQTAIAKRVMAQLQEAVDGGAIKAYEGKTVMTKVTSLTEFTSASQDHQEYLMKNPLGYCNHRIRFSNWPVKKLAVTS